MNYTQAYMKNISFFISLFILFLLAEHNSDAQLLRRKSTAEKATKDLRKRQKEAGEEENAFNPLISFGTPANFSRDDFIWSSETAYTAKKKNGNISIVTPSRYGLGKDFELSTMLPVNYWAPNLMLKKSYTTEKLIIAHRHALYYPTLGLNWAQKKEYYTIVDSLASVPHIASLRNELIVSYPIGSDPECGSGQPYLVLTGGIALDAGIPIGENNLQHIDEHIFGSRSPSLTGQGLLFSARLRVDGRLTDFLFIEGDIKLFVGDFNNKYSLEQHTGLNIFASHNISFTIGYAASYGHFGNSNLRLFPYGDISFYFGKKLTRQRGLFK